jgi:hypothetical protein
MSQVEIRRKKDGEREKPLLSLESFIGKFLKARRWERKGKQRRNPGM